MNRPISQITIRELAALLAIVCIVALTIAAVVALNHDNQQAQNAIVHAECVTDPRCSP